MIQNQMRFVLLSLLCSTAVLAQTTTHTPAASTTPRSRTSASGAAKPKPATAKAPALTTDDDKMVYAVGLSIAQSIASFDLSPAELSILERGLADGAAGKPVEDLNVWGPKIQTLVQARSARVIEKQKAEGTAYLAKAATEPGAVKTESGLIYRELTAGTGASPKATDTVKVNYRGTLLNGTEFDSSYKRGQPAQFALNGVIPCWTEGVQKMKVGGKAQLVCPSSIAYGDRGNRGIPPGATLIFEVELLEIGGAGAGK